MIIPALQSCSSHSASMYQKAVKTFSSSLLFEYCTTQLYQTTSEKQENWLPELADKQPLDRRAPGESGLSQLKPHSSAVLTTPLKRKQIQTKSSVYAFAKDFKVTYLTFFEGTVLISLH